jgi:hypothetical protein
MAHDMVREADHPDESIRRLGQTSGDLNES